MSQTGLRNYGNHLYRSVPMVEFECAVGVGWGGFVHGCGVVDMLVAVIEDWDLPAQALPVCGVRCERVLLHGNGRGLVSRLGNRIWCGSVPAAQ